MLKEIVNYVFSKSPLRIWVDYEDYLIIKTKCTELEERMRDARRLLVRPYVTKSEIKEPIGCIKRRVVFPVQSAENIVCEKKSSVMKEYYCVNFNESAQKFSDSCNIKSCPLYQNYKTYADLKRKYEFLLNEKKSFWQNKICLK